VLRVIDWILKLRLDMLGISDTSEPFSSGIQDIFIPTSPLPSHLLKIETEQEQT
jgi:hypothetical protein